MIASPPLAGKPAGQGAFAFLALLLALLLPSPARSDSWLPPTASSHVSPDGRLRLTITPRGIAGPLAYFEDAAKGKKRPGQRPGAAKSALARLDRQDSAGAWQRLWERPLLNDVAPVDALLADDGRFVTFDNWHSMGLGDHVLVFYGPDGNPLRSLTLVDLLPAFYVEALPRSVSSLWWRGEPRWQGGRLLLPIVIPGEEEPGAEPDHVDFLLDLAAGSAAPVNAARWQAAQAKARLVADARAASARAEEAAFVAPLKPPPPGADEPAWHHYLNDALNRLDPKAFDRVRSTEVLPDPASADYARSLEGLEETMSDPVLRPDAVLIASPAAPANLAPALAGILGRMKPNGLRYARVYVSVPAAWRDAVAAAIAPSGARFVWLDPERPIPQRPERLKRRLPR